MDEIHNFFGLRSWEVQLHDKKLVRIRPASIKIPFMWEPIFNTITSGWPNEESDKAIYDLQPKKKLLLKSSYVGTAVFATVWVADRKTVGESSK